MTPMSKRTARKLVPAGAAAGVKDYWPRDLFGQFALDRPDQLLASIRVGLTIMVNSIFNGNRREDIWLDK